MTLHRTTFSVLGASVLVLIGCSDQSMHAPYPGAPTTSATRKAKHIPSAPEAHVVAHAFSYPGALRYVDLDETLYESAGMFLWGRSYTSGDKTFAKTEVALFEGATHLTKDEIARLEAFFSETQKNFAEVLEEVDESHCLPSTNQ